MKHFIVLIALFSVVLAAPSREFVKGRRIHKKPTTTSTTEETIKEVPDYTKDTEFPDEPKTDCIPNLMPPTDVGYSTIDQMNKCVNVEEQTKNDDKLTIDDQHKDDDTINMNKEQTDDDKINVDEDKINMDEQQTDDDSITMDEQPTDNDKVNMDEQLTDEQKNIEDQNTMPVEEDTNKGTSENPTDMQEKSFLDMHNKNDNDTEKEVEQEEIVTLSSDLTPPYVEAPKKHVKGVKGGFSRRKIDN